jgi:hypothetical protein
MTAITAEEKRELVERFGKAPNDTGATEVQIALLTSRINHLTEHRASTSTTTTRAGVFSCLWAGGAGSSTTCRRRTSRGTAR